MEQFIGCDAHKRFSVFVAVNEKGQSGEALRVAHDRQLYREFLARLPPHSAIAMEASGSYSWLVDEMERSGPLKTLPCVGKVLSRVLMLEIGRVDRFPTAAHLASYAELVPRVHSSGGHTRMGQVCGNVNRNL